jgi:hypothetical protein
MKVEVIILSEVSRSEKDKYWLLLSDTEVSLQKKKECHSVKQGLFGDKNQQVKGRKKESMIDMNVVEVAICMYENWTMKHS